MSFFSGVTSFFSGTPANPVRSKVEPNTVINMGPVYEQARNNARRRANEWARQMRNETNSNPALAAEMRQRMANIAAAQRSARNANAARRAANIAGPNPTRRVRKKFTPSLPSVPEGNEMSGGRRSRRKSNRK
jgi:transketolase